MICLIHIPSALQPWYTATAIPGKPLTAMSQLLLCIILSAINHKISQKLMLHKIQIKRITVSSYEII